MTTTTRLPIPTPRTPADPPEGIPAAVWRSVHPRPRDDGRDTTGWIACGAFEIRFDNSDDDRRNR